MKISDKLGEVLEIIRTDIDIDTTKYDLAFKAYDDSDIVVCSLAALEPIPPHKRRETAVSIMTTHKHDIGAFALMQDGTLYYRAGILHASELLSVQVLRDLLAAAIEAFEEFNGNKRTGDSNNAEPENTLLPVVRSTLEAMDLEFEEMNDSCVVTHLVSGEETVHVVPICTDPGDGVVYCSICYPLEPPYLVDEDRRAEVAEQLCEANSEMDVGKLDIDLQSGVTSFVTSMRMSGNDLTEDIVQTMLRYGWEALHEFDGLFSDQAP
jgi:hypothetical protein